MPKPVLKSVEENSEGCKVNVNQVNKICMELDSGDMVNSSIVELKGSGVVSPIKERLFIQSIPICEQDEKMIVKQVPTIDFNKCHPERCDSGICIAADACPHKVFFQEQPYDFPMHIASMCMGCGSCSGACPLRAIRMI